METVHIAAYALLLETLGMPDSEFAAFMDYTAMRDKHDYLQTFGVDDEADILRTLAMFGGFAEGLQLFASFAILLNFPRHNKMRGMGQVVSWSVRDETLHCEGIIRLFHAFASETGALTNAVRDDIVDCARTVVRLEDRFIDLAFELGPIDGLTAPDVKAYIRYIADWRLKQLGAAEPLRRQGASAAVAHGATERRRARELLRDARDRVREGGNGRRLARHGRRVGLVRPARDAPRSDGVARRLERSARELSARAAVIETTLLDGVSSDACSPCTQRTIGRNSRCSAAAVSAGSSKTPRPMLGGIDVHVRIADAPEERDAERRHELLERRVHGLVVAHAVRDDGDADVAEPHVADEQQLLDEIRRRVHVDRRRRDGNQDRLRARQEVLQQQPPRPGRGVDDELPCVARYQPAAVREAGAEARRQIGAVDLARVACCAAAASSGSSLGGRSRRSSS